MVLQILKEFYSHLKNIFPERRGLLLYCLIIDLKAYNKITQLRNGTPFHKSRFFPL